MKYLNDIKNVYFIGIGGISMSALAIILSKNGYNVAGSDIVKSDITKKLESLGIKVNYKQIKHNIKNYDICIYNSAIKNNNEEYIACLEKGIPLIKRAELLEEISSLYKNIISVTGTHGKTTTTGIISTIFNYCNKKPTIHIGGVLDSINGNVQVGEKEYFITEACEYMDNFLFLNSKVGVITNIEEDHLDYFKNYENIISSFNKFAEKCKQIVIVNENYSKYIKVKHLTYGKNNNSFASYKITKINKYLGYDFDVYIDKKYYDSYSLKIIGEKNVENATASILISFIYNLDKKLVKKAINNFNGVNRRFEFIGKINNCNTYIDYAHHPTEIKNVIDNLKKVTTKKIHVIFQPHTYSRTQKLFSNFVDILKNIDNLVIYKTYPAREEPIEGGNYLDLYKKIKDYNSNVLKAGNIQALKKFLIKNIKNDEIVLFLGAGSIDLIAKKIVKDLSKI